MKICVYGAASNQIDKSYIQAGERLGRAMAQRGHSLVFGGGANGMMGAVARGTTDKGGEIIGIAPSFFNVDGVLYDKCTQFISTDTMRERKALMEEHSDAFIVSAGGIGTFEEFLEIMTLRSLDRHHKPIAIFNTNGFYEDLFSFMHKCVDENFMKKENLELFFVSDDECAVLDYLENYSNTDSFIEKTRYI